MSRFFASGDTTDESDYSDAEVVTKSTAATKKATGLQAYIDMFKGAIQRNDWTSAKEAYDELIRKLPAQPTVPAMKAILNAELEVGATMDDKRAKNKLSATALKALTTLSTNITAFLDKHSALADKVADMESEEEPQDDEEEEEEEEEVKPKKSTPKSSKYGFSDDEGSYDDTGSSEDESKSAAEESATEDDDWMNQDDDDINLSAIAHKITRAFWLKKETVATGVETKKTISQDERRAQRQAEAQRRRKDDEEEQSEGDDELAQKVESPEMDANAEISPEQMARRVHEVWLLRGRKGETATIRQTVAYLLTKTDDMYMTLRLKMLDILTAFDATLNKGRSMTIPSWSEAVEGINDVMRLLASHPKVKLVEDDAEALASANASSSDAAGFNFLQLEALGFEDPFSQRKQQAEAASAASAARAQSADSDVQYVEGSIYSLVFKAYTEHNKALCLIENPSSNTAELATRLREQPKLLRLLKASRDYYIRLRKPQVESLIASMWLELEYFRYQPKLDAATPDYVKPSTKSLVEDLVAVVMHSADPYGRARAILMQVYHWAVHNRYQEARSLMLSSQLPHFINDADIKTRILFNRTMVQIGMAAFRAGEFKHAMHALLDFFEHSPKRFNVELVAQGVLPRLDAREEEVLEAKRRILPYHMHFNIENVETVFFVSTMLIDVPSIAEHGWHLPKQGQSKAFRRAYFRFTEALASMCTHVDVQRDIPMHATRALLEGDWKQCIAHLDRLRLWTSVHNVEAVKALLHAEVQKVALKAFLLMYGTHFATIPLSMLVEDFALPASTVSKIVSQLMHQDLLRACWDKDSETIIVLQSAASKLGKLSQLFVERIGQMLEANERVLGSGLLHDGVPGSGPSYGYGRRQDRYNQGAGMNAGTGRYNQGGRRWGDRSGHARQAGNNQSRGKNPRSNQQRGEGNAQWNY